MIHDSDLGALAWSDSPVRGVSAVGWSVLGGHEDVARAKVEFASGCVAQFSVSRVSRQAIRQMEVWSPRGQTSIDFSTRKTVHTEPSRARCCWAVRSAAVHASRTATFCSNTCSTSCCRPHEVESPANNAILEEQRDFAECVHTGRTPLVDGTAGLAAVRVAEQVLHAIAAQQQELTQRSHDAVRQALSAKTPTILKRRSALGPTGNELQLLQTCQLKKRWLTPASPGANQTTVEFKLAGFVAGEIRKTVADETNRFSSPGCSVCMPVWVALPRRATPTVLRMFHQPTRRRRITRSRIRQRRNTCRRRISRCSGSGHTAAADSCINSRSPRRRRR